MICQVCGVGFEVTTRWQIVCSVTCRSRRFRALQDRPTPATELCRECGKPFPRANGRKMCSIGCVRARNLRKKREWISNNPEKAKESSRRYNKSPAALQRKRQSARRKYLLNREMILQKHSDDRAKMRLAYETLRKMGVEI